MDKDNLWRHEKNSIKEVQEASCRGFGVSVQGRGLLLSFLPFGKGRLRGIF
jgi:hypothetical protein